jgi:U3 small nucleolar ribonucleoprotein protein IMP3
MRQLKHHEQKLLKKVNFLRWKNEHNLRELQVSRAEAASSCQAPHSNMAAVEHRQQQQQS